MTVGSAVIADLTGAIETSIDAGEPLDRVEQEILNRHDLDSDTKNGLALYAWAWSESRPRVARGKGRGRMSLTLVEA